MTRRLLRVALPLAALAACAVLAAPAGADDGIASFPSTGAFVIGDGSAVVGASVTFWGAQWWKQNDVLSGSGPASFKGFADNLASGDPCRPFTTRPGNSSKPPDGPLPQFMLALVTASVTKSGPTITGSVIGLAVIQTDDGYAPNPGHAGTGTVTALIPCGIVIDPGL